MSIETKPTEFDRELLSAFVDGELSGGERAAVEAQLATDADAMRQVAEFRRLSGLIQDLPRPALPADFSAKVLQRAAQSGPPSQVEPRRSSLSIGRRLAAGGWRNWAWAGAALAAALVIAVTLPGPPREQELARNDAPTAGRADRAVPEMHALQAPAEEPPESSAPPEALAIEDQLAAGSAAESGLGKFSVTDAPAEGGTAFAAAAENPRLLIVRVSMSQAALAGRALDEVLARNGIEIETADTRAASRDKDSAQDTTRLRGGEAGAGGEAEPVEVVLVEAPLEQINSTLSTLQGDAENFYAVRIEEDSPLLKEELAQANQFADQWRQYNRLPLAEPATLAEELAVAPAAPTEAVPLTRAPTEAAPPPPAAVEVSPRRATADTAAPHETEVRLDQQSAAKGRAFRYLAPAEGWEPVPGDFARQQVRAQEAPTELGFRGDAQSRAPLQVLFVLQGTPPPIAAPVPAEPAPPAEPPR